MSRIRTIKPDFWTSAQVMELGLVARLMFIGMWNFADDAGRMAYSPKTIKAQVFPADDLSVESVRGMINELSANGLIIIYAVEDKEYLQITGWHHQRIDKPQKPKCPAPFFDDSKNDQGMVATDPIVREGKGREDAAIAAPPSSDEKQVYDLGKEILGSSSGGLVKKLIVAKGESLPLAHAALLTAKTKSNPREYIGAIIRSRDGPSDGRSF